MKEFRQKVGSWLPVVPRNNPPQGRTEFSGLNDLLQYIIDVDKEKKEAAKSADTKWSCVYSISVQIFSNQIIVINNTSKNIRRRRDVDKWGTLQNNNIFFLFFFFLVFGFSGCRIKYSRRINTQFLAYTLQLSDGWWSMILNYKTKSGKETKETLRTETKEETIWYHIVWKRQ